MIIIQLSVSLLSSKNHAIENYFAFDLSDCTIFFFDYDFYWNVRFWVRSVVFHNVFRFFWDFLIFASITLIWLMLYYCVINFVNFQSFDFILTMSNFATLRILFVTKVFIADSSRRSTYSLIDWVSLWCKSLMSLLNFRWK